jgi:uncharacterized delta-60 repeat protein
MKQMLLVFLTALSTCFIASAQSVNVDQTFGNCGTLSSMFQGYENLTLEQTLVRPDGRIVSVATGQINSSIDHHTLITQYHPNGEPDLSFGTNGKAIIALNTKTICKQIALLPGGEIIGVGTDSDDQFTASHIPLVFKLNANGSVDQTFNSSGGAGGKNALRFNAFSRGGFTNVKVLPDGKILAAGESVSNGIGGLSGPGVMRFNSDGTVDQSFGNNIPGFPGRTVVSKAYISNVNMLVNDNGQIILAYSRDDLGQGINISLEIVVLEADGVIEGGTADVPAINTGLRISGIMRTLRQPDGKLLFVATSNETTSKIFVLRYLSAVTPDPAFGINGVVTLANIDGSNASFYGSNIGLQRDGKILLTGGKTTGYPNNTPFVVRLTATGQPDASFNGSGYFFVPNYLSNSRSIDVVSASNQTCIISQQANLGLVQLTAETRAATGGSLKFDGGDDVMNVGNWFNAQNFSVEMWLKPNAAQPANAGVIDNGAWQLYRAGATGNTYYFFVTDNSNTVGRYSAVDLTSDTWQHIVLVKDAGSILVYKNGQLVSTSVHTGSVVYSGSPILWLGRAEAVSRGWSGSFDEVRLWNRPLSATEIQTNRNCQLTCTQNDLLAYYKFNQGYSGCRNVGINTVPDASGNNHVGTLINFSMEGVTSNFLDGYLTENCASASQTYYVDADRDGYGTGTGEASCTDPGIGYSLRGGDCNDDDASIHEPVQYYVDADRDGFGSSVTELVCSATVTVGFSTNNNDCDDTNPGVYPGATEVCNGIDDNCNGDVDEGGTNTFYRDADGDGSGNATMMIQACSAPSGYVSNSNDCDDSNGDVYPGATEVCNGIDDNCNGEVDEGGTSTFYRDADGDGNGNARMMIQSCSAPSGFVSNSNDCDDSNGGVYPGATEVCNGFDDNCNGEVDEGGTSTFYRDADGDGYGNDSESVQGCVAPSGYVDNNSDCDDANANVRTGMTEICNGIDDNCNGLTDEGCPVVNRYRSRASGNWSSIATWEVSANMGVTWTNATRVPFSNDRTITIRASHSVTIDIPIATNEVIVESAAVLILGQTLTLTDDIGIDLLINGTFTMNTSAALQGSGETAISGVLNFNGGLILVQTNILASGVVNINGTATKAIFSRVDNAGIINLANFHLNISGVGIYNTGRINVSSGTTSFLSSSANGAPAIRNSAAGVVTKSGRGLVYILGGIDNHGLVRTDAGVFYIGVLNNAGAVNVNSSSTLLLQSANFRAGTELLGTGTVSSLASTNVVDPLVIPEGLQFMLTSGEIVGRKITVSGFFRWTAGKVACDIEVTPNGRIAIELSDRKNLSSTITNDGTIEWRGGEIVCENGTVINNNLFHFNSNDRMASKIWCEFIY